jgi:hypothetical protein
MNKTPKKNHEIRKICPEKQGNRADPKLADVVQKQHTYLTETQFTQSPLCLGSHGFYIVYLG